MKWPADAGFFIGRGASKSGPHANRLLAIGQVLLAIRHVAAAGVSTAPPTRG